MSWSVNAIGKAPAVAAKLAEQFGKIKCMEPEETIKNVIAGVVATALGAFPEATTVKVVASGSQASGTDGKASNSLNVSIEPQWGFVE